jgi:hypothetical protein
LKPRLDKHFRNMTKVCAKQQRVLMGDALLQSKLRQETLVIILIIMFIMMIIITSSKSTGNVAQKCG